MSEFELNDLESVVALHLSFPRRIPLHFIQQPCTELSHLLWTLQQSSMVQ